MEVHLIFNGKYKLTSESLQTKFQIEIPLSNKKVNDNY